MLATWNNADNICLISNNFSIIKQEKTEFCQNLLTNSRLFVESLYFHKILASPNNKKMSVNRTVYFHNILASLNNKKLKLDKIRRLP